MSRSLTPESSDADLSELFVSASSVASAYAPPSPIVQSTFLVGGDLQSWSGKMKRVVSPVHLRDEQGSIQEIELGQYPLLGERESELALQAALQAYDDGKGAWATMATTDRIGHMRRFATRLAGKRSEIVRIISWEIGKSWRDAEKEFDRTIEYINATIEALRQLENENSRFQIVDGTIGQIRRTPLGIVLCMGPYNYPLNETFATLIPALIMGNSVILKPPKIGVLLFSPLLDLLRDEFPSGVVNVLYGQGEDIVPHLVTSGRLNALTLIGSSKVADHLKKLHPKSNRLRSVLGLDAKNAAVILADADLEFAARECVAGALSFNGQRCTALKVILVHSKIADRFLNRLRAAIESLRLGMPWENDVDITPLPEPGKTAKMRELIEDAVSKGARVVNQGGGRSFKTLFVPALVFPVTQAMRLYREEQFGPIVPVVAFDDVDFVLQYVSSSDYGQQISLFGTDADEIGRLVDPLVNQVCRVNINCQCQRGPDVFPFSGRKDSAEGTLSISDALRAFSIRSMVASRETDSSKKLISEIVRSGSSRFMSAGFTF